MSCININTVTIEYFKTLFSRDFPYLPVYVDGKAYFKDDVVYYNGNFYKSLTDGNETAPTNTTNWALTPDSVENYIQDSDIERAFEEAKGSFNTALFSDCNTAQMYFCYVAAHYLVMDIYNAQNALSMGFNGMVASKSVGSVSESYGIPQWIMNSPLYGMFAQTGYGRKYLMHVIPLARASALILTPGRTTIE